MRSAVQLRPYQARAVEELHIALERYKRVLFYAPTGAGKGFLFGYLAKCDLDKKRKVLVISSRTEILKQNLGYLYNFDIEATFVNPQSPSVPKNDITVAMAQTLRRRIEKEEWRDWLQTIDICYIDEAQECVSDFIHPFLRKDAYVCGMSGSPHRYGKMKQLGDMYRCLVSSVSVQELIDLGYLAKPHLYSIASPTLADVPIDYNRGDYNQKSLAAKFEDKTLYKGVVDEYIRLCADKKAICFCVSSKQAIEITKEFTERGVKAKYVLSGNFDDDHEYSGERSEVVSGFINNEFQVLVNVGVFVAGFDAPDVEVVIANFATTSLTKWRQSLGRGARTTPTKKEFVILDCGCNYKRLGRYEQEHTNCLWHDVGNSSGMQMLKQCDPDKPDINGKKGCAEFVPSTCKVCPNCGRVFVTEKHEYIMHLEEVATKEEKDIVTWAAQRRLEGWNLDRIMKQVCLANVGREKQAVMTVYLGLNPTKTEKEASFYWYSYKKYKLNYRRKT